MVQSEMSHSDVATGCEPGLCLRGRTQPLGLPLFCQQPSSFCSTPPSHCFAADCPSRRFFQFQLEPQLLCDDSVASGTLFHSDLPAGRGSLFSSVQQSSPLCLSCIFWSLSWFLHQGIHHCFQGNPEQVLFFSWKLSLLSWKMGVFIRTFNLAGGIVVSCLLKKLRILWGWRPENNQQDTSQSLRTRLKKVKGATEM